MSGAEILGGPAPQTPRDISGQKTLQPGEAEIVEAVRSGAGPMRIRGGGTRDVGRPVSGEVLSTAGTSGIRLYEPGALTLVAGAGTPLPEVEAALAAEGQRLAFEPPDWRALLGTDGTPTIGGVVATNASGPRRVSFIGACRDAALGVRIVDGQGRVIRNGGRVMKNVTGYDLVRLFCGSWGTLGVLTEVALKVLPAPETEATLILPDVTPAEAATTMAAALGSPFEVSGAAFGPLGAAGQGTALRLEGFADQVAYRTRALTDRLGREAQVLGHEASAELWRAVRDVTAFTGDAVVVRVSIRPSRLPALAEAVAAHGAPRILADWGGGLAWLALPEAEVEQGDALLAAARDFVATHGGHATLWKAPAALRALVPVFQPEPGPVAALSAGLRAQFDPKGFFNPGLMT